MLTPYQCLEAVPIENKIGDSQSVPQTDQPLTKVAPLYPRDAKNLVACADVFLSLLTLLDTYSHPTHCEGEIRCLARTSQTHSHHLKALVDLWQSLGRPDSTLWLETRVFYNR